MTSLAPVLQRFFSAKLIGQEHASSHTIRSYRDALRLLLIHAQRATGTPPWQMDIGQLTPELITGFLRSLEAERRNSPRTRNSRLAAIHALLRYAALYAPDNAATIQQVLAIKGTRTTRNELCWLTAAEATALVTACDTGTWIGRRDHALLLVALCTGLRVSELIHLTRGDIELDTGPHIRCMGKGRKERCVPLDKPTVAVLRQWLTERGGGAADVVFCTSRGHLLSRDAIQSRLDKYHPIATQQCPSLASKHLTPHTLRHSTAMRLKRAGVDITVIAAWLGHDSIASTQIYMHTDLEEKERALARLTSPGTLPGRYQPDDQLLAFLRSL
jgi:integrase/recombinase XerD